jgi:GNAT superfamily N-acetyltransferase
MEKLIIFLLYIYFAGTFQLPEMVTKDLSLCETGIPLSECYLNEADSLKAYSENECKLYGYWDSLYTPEGAPGNVWKVYTTELDRVPENINVIPMISGFEPDMSRSAVQQHLQLHLDIIDEYDNIEFILLHDEPRHKGFSVELLELIVEEAKKINPDYRYAFTFSRGNARNEDLPSNADIVGINFYPFYYQSYYPQRYFTTKKQFNDHLNSTIRSVKSKVENAEILVVGQGIYDESKYREPPVESALWYAEYIKKSENIIGLLWFEWRDRQVWKGTRSIADLYEQQKEAFELLCRKK